MRADHRFSGGRSFQPFPRGQDFHNSYASNRSNQSAVHSDYLRKMLEDAEMYPSGFAQLLKFEERNIKVFKAQIAREKDRVNDDMASFKTEINHTLEDLRLSLHAQLDRIYQGYIERYAKFKGELLEINRLKDQIEVECGGINVPSKGRDLSTASTLTGTNNQTIAQMENGVKQLKKYHFLNYVAELQKERILPLNDLQREIVILNEYNNGFYQPKQFHKILQGLKQFISEEVHRVYDNCHLYIREVDGLLFKEEPRILDEVYDRSPPIDRRQYIAERPFIERSQAERRPVIVEKSQTQPALHKVNQNASYESMPRVVSYEAQRGRTTERVVGQAATNSNLVGSPLYGEVSLSQQAVHVDWAEKVNLSETSRFRVSNSQIALCGIGLEGGKIALGFKDGTIQVVSSQGQVIQNLRQHNAGICTLAVVRIRGRTYLASGSDINCSRVILWDVNTWQPLQRFQNHKAAVTAIIDLQDDSHILSGSYDKKINVYNVEQGRFLYSLPANDTPVTGAIINRNASKVITCGLDKTLNVWQVVRSSGKVDSLFLERKITNNVLICSLVASSFQNDLVIVGTKDGKIKMINIDKGESYKTVSVSQNYLIEMLLVERSSKPYYPLILAWPYKEKKLYVVNPETSVITSKPTQSYLEFGCGVSPKCFFTQRGGSVCSVSHSEEAKEVTLFRLEEIK